VEEMAMGGPFEEAVAAEALEGVVAEEDLWAMEELSSEGETAEELVEETLLEPVETPLEEVSITEAFEFAEDLGAEVETEKAITEAFAEMAPEAVTLKPAAVAVPSVEVMSAEKAAEIFKQSVDEKIASLLSSIDMKEIVLTSLGPSVKDSAEKVLWEVAPELVERLLKEMLKGSLATIAKEVEKVIWETVPDLAESMISKEIQRIKSEL
jgi:hypothetical protein